MADGSEYGGRPGILQGPEGDVTDKGIKAPGHSLTASEQAMVANRAGKMEAGGVVQRREIDEDGIWRGGVVGYDESRAAQDLIDGTNDPIKVVSDLVRDA